MRWAPAPSGPVLGGCLKRVEPPLPASPRAVRLLVATEERETAQWPERRTDLTVDTDFERVPHVVATGETGLLPAQNVEVTLAGDEAGTKSLFDRQLHLARGVVARRQWRARARPWASSTESAAVLTASTAGARCIFVRAARGAADGVAARAWVVSPARDGAGYRRRRAGERRRAARPPR